MAKISCALMIFVGLGVGVGAWAGDSLPECVARDGSTLAVNNSDVLAWKKSTTNLFGSRGHIVGQLVTVLPAEKKSQSFLVQIGNDESDVVEVLFSLGFGELPELHPGMAVEACGDYVTLKKGVGGVPASPAGAVIHWVHSNRAQPKHPVGYLVLDGQVHGL